MSRSLRSLANYLVHIFTAASIIITSSPFSVTKANIHFILMTAHNCVYWLLCYNCRVFLFNWLTFTYAFDHIFLIFFGLWACHAKKEVIPVIAVSSVCVWLIILCWRHFASLFQLWAKWLFILLYCLHSNSNHFPSKHCQKACVLHWSIYYYFLNLKWNTKFSVVYQ